MQRAFTIMEAKSGGFVVVSSPSDSQYAREVLFAGTVGECLKFIELEFAKSKT